MHGYQNKGSCHETETPMVPRSRSGSNGAILARDPIHRNSDLYRLSLINALEIARLRFVLDAVVRARATQRTMAIPR